MTRRVLTLLCTAAAAVWLTVAIADEEKSPKPATVTVRKLADSLHEIIAADREAYLEAMAARSGTGTADNNCPRPPVHAELLRAAARKIQTHGAEFSYTLRSLAPINANNGPQTEVEQRGLAAVAQHPDEPVYANEELGGRSYFTAIYADRAVLASCVECHNQEPRGPRHDWKRGEVMGAIVVRIPLEF